MSDGLKRARAAAKATQIAARVARVLDDHGFDEAGTDRTGYYVAVSGAKVIVTPVLEDHAEGHFDSPAHHEMQASMTYGYREALEDAGWSVTVHTSGEGLTVAGRARG